MKKENEEIMIEIICQKYHRKERFVKLLFKICKDNNIKNSTIIIENELK